jgi:flagellar biosynthetic protein FlhB
MAETEDADQRTEQATPRRRLEAREKGQVPLSMELIAALLLIAWTALLALGGGTLGRAIGGALGGSLEQLGQLGRQELSVANAAALVGDVGLHVGRVMLVLSAPLVLFGALAGYVQVGFQVTPKAIEADPAKLNPLKGLQRMFSARTVMRTTLAFAKLSVIAGVMALVAWSQLDRIVALAGSDLGPALAGVGHIALRCVAGALAAVLVLAAADAAFQRWQHERDLRMTRQELREELKNLEGDPHIRARIRRVQRELASRRMMADVPKATVVVTNPTHYAVALRYERAPEGGRASGAPRVVAKGLDAVAQRIKEVAREAGVLCYEDVPLARALHARCEIGEEVPVDLFQAVAEVLAYVYRIQGAAPVAAEAR